MPPETEDAAPSPAALTSTTRQPPSATLRVLGVAAVLYFVASLAFFTIPRVDDIIETPVDDTDFQVFYAASNLIVRGEGGELYKRNAEVTPEFKIGAGNYFNPLLFAMLLAPLTLLGAEEARAVFVLVMLACALAAVLVIPSIRTNALLAVAGMLAMATFLPAQESLHLGQPSLLYALLTAAALSAALGGKDAAAGWAASLLVMKPSLALAPLGLVAFLGHKQAIRAAVLGVLVFGAAPFFILGLGAIRDFAELLSASRSAAFLYEGHITAGAKYMFNWNGFIARLFQVDPAPAVVFPLYLLTALLVIKVWSLGDIAASWLAATLGTLLAIPHMLFYDWAILLPVALVFFAQRRTIGWGVLLLAVHLAVNLSMVEVLNGPQNRAFVLATPAAFVLLLALAFEPQLRWLNARRLWEERHLAATAAEATT